MEPRDHPRVQGHVLLVTRLAVVRRRAPVQRPEVYGTVDAIPDRARLRDLFAAAIAGEADLLVTWNVADFPLEPPSDVGFRS